MEKQFTLSVLSACYLAFAFPALAASSSSEHVTTSTRDTLTGSWGGVRSDAEARGIDFDLSVTGYYAGLFSGGVEDDDFDFGGRADAMLKLDSGKLGLWQGGGLHTHLETRFGDAADRPVPRSGGIWPPNTGVVLPLGPPDRVRATSIYLSQSFGESTNVMLGKINTVGLLANHPFFGGWARDRFTNVAFVAPPSGVVPPSIMGGILNYRLATYTLTFMAFDPNDRTDDYWPDDLFSDGVNLSFGVTWTGDVATRSSSAGITATYSTKDGADLSDFLLPPDLRGGTNNNSYNIALNFSHMIYELPGSPNRGLGLYAKPALADGNPNPIEASFIGGLAGYGLVPNRPADYFGIGYYYYDLSDDLESALEPLGPEFSIDNEQGLEMYYNLEVVPWMRITADVQWIDPARAFFGHTWVGGLRMNIIF